MKLVDMNIFAYGTLMIPEVMVAVTARKFRFEKAILRGYARFTVEGECYPGIMPVASAMTEGIVYLDVDERSLERLDQFEGDLYQRSPVSVETDERKIRDAETYAIKPEYKGCLSSKKWNVTEFSQKHLKAFLETYQGLR